MTLQATAPTRGAAHAVVLPTAGVSAQDREKWLALVADSAEASPYYSPEYLTTRVDHTGEPVMDSVLVALDADGTWLGLTALWDTPRDEAWPRHHLSTGWFHVTTPLLRRGREDDALLAMLTELLRDGRHGPVLDFQFLPGDSPAVDGLRRAARAAGLAVRTRTALVGPWLAPRDGDESGISPSKRERKKMSQLAARIGVGELTVRDVSDEPDAVDRYLALEAQGWKADGDRGGYGLNMRPEWFRELYAGLRARDAIRMLAVDGPSETAYLSLLLLDHGIAHGFLDAYPDALREFSPGTSGRLLTVDYCLRQDDIAAFDPGTDPDGVSPTLERMFPDRREWVGLTVARAGWPSLLLTRLDSPRLQRTIEGARGRLLAARRIGRSIRAGAPWRRSTRTTRRSAPS